jgi:hypothetical protein
VVFRLSVNPPLKGEVKAGEVLGKNLYVRFPREKRWPDVPRRLLEILRD